jgi:hypothetical protein
MNKPAVRLLLKFIWIGLLGSSGATHAQSICLNPFGCRPETRAECIKQVATAARSEAGARAALGECRKLPAHTLAECRKAEGDWARHLKQSEGAEWAAPQRLMKEGCRDAFPQTFNVRLWVTPDYCRKMQVTLAQGTGMFEPGSRISKGVQRFTTDYGYTGSHIWIIVEAMQKVVYPHMPVSEVASRLFMDSPPDRPDVAAFCQSVLSTGATR